MNIFLIIYLSGVITSIVYWLLRSYRLKEFKGDGPELIMLLMLSSTGSWIFVLVAVFMDITTHYKNTK